MSNGQNVFGTCKIIILYKIITHKIISFYFVKFYLSIIESHSHNFASKENVSFSWFRNDKCRWDVILFSSSDVTKISLKLALAEMQFICILSKPMKVLMVYILELCIQYIAIDTWTS